MQTAQPLTPSLSKTGLTVDNVNDDPPAQGNMVELGYAKVPGPLYLEAIIAGEDAIERALTGAYWFGWHRELDKAVVLAPVNNGYDVGVSTAKFHRDVLPFVCGTYSHIGIGKGTLAASTIALRITPIEVMG
jgi:hypothetical protein